MWSYAIQFYLQCTFNKTQSIITKHLCHPRIHLNSHANIHPQQPAPKRIKFDTLDSTSSSIYQPSMSVFNFAEMLEAQDDSIHVKSSQRSLKFVSDTSVVIGDDNDHLFWHPHFRKFKFLHPYLKQWKGSES